jgi:outer membrane protein assembly factor BamB
MIYCDKRILRLLCWGMLFLLFSVAGCTHQEAPTQFYNWVIPASNSFEFYPIRTVETIILSSDCQERPCIRAVDLKTGIERWSYTNEYLDQLFYNALIYLDQQYLVLPLGKQLLCLDIKTGKAVWKYETNFAGDDYVTGDGRYAYRVYPKANGTVLNVLRFKLKTGAKDTVRMQAVRNANYALMRSPSLAMEKDTFLVSPVIDYLPLELTNSYILAWKKGEAHRAAKYKIAPTNRKGIGAALPPFIKDGASYWVVDKEVVRYNIIKSKENWRRRLPKGMLTSRLNMIGDTLLVACENEYLYGMSANNGQIIWKVKTAGTPSRVASTPGYLFLIGGSDRLLYRISRANPERVEKYTFKNEKRLLKRVSFFSSQAAILNDGNNWHSIPLCNLPDSLQRVK